MSITIFLLLTVLLQVINAATVIPEPMSDIVCEGEVATPSCPPGFTINILTAMYGKKDRRICNMPGQNVNDCASSNSLNLVKYRCNSKQFCQIPATNEVFNDPCYGTRKYLEITYQCLSEPDLSTSIACENERLRLQCPQGKYLWIVNANYGRLNPATCYFENKDIRTNRCAASRAKHIIESRCENLESCEIDAKNEIFGDPCYGTYKYLQVVYKCI